MTLDFSLLKTVFLLVFFSKTLCPKEVWSNDNPSPIEISYKSVPAPDGKYVSMTTNILWMKGAITCLDSKNNRPRQITDVAPLSIPKKLIIPNELISPYSTKKLNSSENNISFQKKKILFSFSNHSKSGGLFFENSQTGLVFNTADEPISLRSREDIYLQPKINTSHPPILGTGSAKNWSFVDNSNHSSGGVVALLAHEIVCPELCFKNTLTGNFDVSIQSSSPGNERSHLLITTPASAKESGLIVENTDGKTLFSIRDDGKSVLEGNLTLNGTFINTKFLNDLVIPKGVIIAFFSQNPPDTNRWQKCNGSAFETDTLNSTGLNRLLKLHFKNLKYRKYSTAPSLLGGYLRHKNKRSDISRVSGNRLHKHTFSQSGYTLDFSHGHTIRAKKGSRSRFVCPNYSYANNPLLYKNSSDTVVRASRKYNFFHTNSLGRPSSETGAIAQLPAGDPPLLSETMTRSDLDFALSKNGIAIMSSAEYKLFKNPKTPQSKCSLYTISGIHRHALVPEEDYHNDGYGSVKFMNEIIPRYGYRDTLLGWSRWYRRVSNPKVDIDYTIPKKTLRTTVPRNDTATTENNIEDNSYLPKYAQVAFYVKK